MNNITELYHDEIFKKLIPLGEPNRIIQAANDKKSNLKFLAIRVPKIKMAIKEGFSFYNLAENEVLSILNDIWHNSPYFEVMSVALGYYSLRKSKISPDVWPCICNWAQRVENWAHSDELSSIYSYLLENQPAYVYSQLELWNHSEDQWLRRISLVSLIHYSGKNAVFLSLEKVLPFIDSTLLDNRFYVQRALGWVLRENSRIYPNQIRDYIQDHLSDLSSVAFANAVDYFSKDIRQGWIVQRKTRSK